MKVSTTPSDADLPGTISLAPVEVLTPGSIPLAVDRAHHAACAFRHEPAALF